MLDLRPCMWIDTDDMSTLHLNSAEKQLKVQTCQVTGVET